MFISSRNIFRIETYLFWRCLRQCTLAHDFFNVGPKTLAENLLGKMLVKEENGFVLKGLLVETEAYLGPQDLASHSSRKLKKALHTYSPPGTFGLTSVYGKHTVLSISSSVPGSCVLIRSLEPILGLDVMIENYKKKKNLKEYRLCSGPGRLCQAFNLTSGMNTKNLFITDSALKVSQNKIVKCPRIGLKKEKVGKWYDECLRFYILGHTSVSHRSKKIESEILKNEAINE